MVARVIGKAAIAGLGMTEMGKVYGRGPVNLAGEAIALALADAGLAKADVDGLLVAATLAPESARPEMQGWLGFRDLAVFDIFNAAGSTAGTMLQFASLAIDAGLAETVVLVHTDAPLVEGGSAGAAYRNASAITGLSGLRSAYGDFGANVSYALGARRHMDLYGTTSAQIGAIAVATREWAQRNEAAQIRKPLTLDDHQASRMIVDPLHLFDCCIVSNGAIALVVTSAERAAELRQPPVYVRGIGQSAPGDNQRAGRDPWVVTGGGRASRQALDQAGLSLSDIDNLQLYDCYTYTVLVTLEDYGFCEKGEGGAFVEDGKLGPGGSLPTNTGGGQLSGYYMWGFTPLSEAVIQVRGQAGARQLERHDNALVSGNGGTFNFHASTILSSTQPE
jgi:acetyl-CoA acetyltransferase